MAGVAGIGPANDRVKVCCLTTWLHPNKRVVGEDGFEPPNPKELIYSQPRLATSLFAHRFRHTLGLQWWMLQGSDL